MVTSEWGTTSAAEALLCRLQSFLPVPKKGQSLINYLGVGYPLFGNADSRWYGIREMKFPLLVTGDRILTECYVQSICPGSLETVALDALATGDWKIPDGLHIRVWTKQPIKKTAAASHVLPETVQAFRDAGIRAVEFMNTVKTAENSVRIAEMNVDVSRLFYEEWVSVMRSGEPYICFLPERKQDRIVPGLRWFQSALGLSFNGDNRKIAEDDLQAKTGCSGVSFSVPMNSSEAIWLWKVQELARADVSARQSGVLSASGWGNLKFGLGRRLNDVVKTTKKTDKPRAELIFNIGTNLLGMAGDGKSSDVLEALSAIRDDEDLAWWWSGVDAIDEYLRENGLNVTF